MPTPGSFTAKTAALATLATVLLTANLLAVQPLYEAYRENSADIAASRERLRRYQALAAEKPGLMQQLTSLQSEVSSSSAYLEGASHPLAAADLQDLVAADINNLRCRSPNRYHQRHDARQWAQTHTDYTPQLALARCLCRSP